MLLHTSLPLHGRTPTPRSQLSLIGNRGEHHLAAIIYLSPLPLSLVRLPCCSCYSREFSEDVCLEVCVRRQQVLGEMFLTVVPAASGRPLGFTAGEEVVLNICLHWF